MTTADIDVQTVLKGRHFADLGEARVCGFSCLYTNLHTWLFDVPHLDVQEIAGEERAYRVRHNRGTLWEAQVVGGLRISNTFSFKRKGAYKPNPSVTFSHVDGLLIGSEEPRALDDLFRAEYIFRSLVNLLGDCQLENAAFECNNLSGGGPSNVECYDERVIPTFSRREDARRGAMPVPYSEIAVNFNAVLQRWYELFDELGQVVNLYLFGKQNRSLDMSTIFLGLMQGVERYHRSFHGGFFMSQDEYDVAVRPALDAAIPNYVQGDFRMRLRAAIQYGHEFSLRRRLREVVALLPTTPTFTEAKDPQHLKASADTRNALAHQVQSPDMHVLEGGALYKAINIWREVIFALALQRLEIEPRIVDLAVRRLQVRRGNFVIP